jgi:hypothetical protein
MPSPEEWIKHMREMSEEDTRKAVQAFEARSAAYIRRRRAHERAVTIVRWVTKGIYILAALIWAGILVLAIQKFG